MKKFAALLFGALLVAGQQASAMTETLGRYTVIYTVVNSTFVEPDVAAAYGLIRARDRAFVNIAVRETLADGSDRAVTAKIEGRSWDLLQNTFLEFREIREQGAIYYIADFEFSDGDMRFFDLLLLPEGAERSSALTFKQKIYEE